MIISSQKAIQKIICLILYPAFGPASYVPLPPKQFNIGLKSGSGIKIEHLRDADVPVICS